MDLKFKKRKSEWKDRPFTVPVTQSKLEEYRKLKKVIDVNEHVREFLDQLLEKYNKVS